MIRPLALLGLALFASFGASAQTVLHYREGQRVDPQDVMQILDQPARGTTRSIRLLADEPASAAGVQSAAGTQGAAAADGKSAAPTALSLPIQFDFDSTDILPSARAQLDALAAGIKLLPAGRSVVIEGHTDASGPDPYNQALSMRRALMVKRYLVREHGIDPQRLRDTGVGERDPIAGLNPYAGENRRVQFRGS